MVWLDILYLIPKTKGTRMLVSAVTKKIDIRSNGIPALAISLVVNEPVEWTIAFGGVPTGIIKP